jgi:hypothetical protein
MRTIFFLTTITLLTVFSLSFSQKRPNTVSSTIAVPDGYIRTTCPAGSFSRWVQSLPLKDSAVILLHTGRPLDEEYAAAFSIFAIVNMPPLFKNDVEQCADYCMRFWAEYHKAAGKLDKLYLFDYSGNKKRFSGSNQSFDAFLLQAFTNSNSSSLKKGCDSIDEADLMPGDMVVQNERGGIGHVSMIVDRCDSKDGKRLYLVGFGFMPAQEFHIEKARDGYGLGGWFTLEGYYRYLDEYIKVGKPCLRRFRAP